MYLGIIGAVTGAVVGVHQAWPFIEPYIPATRDYVVQFVGDNQKPMKQSIDSANVILRDIQIEAFEGKIDANKDAIAKWGLEKDKATDPMTKTMIDQHIHELGVSGERLKSQLDGLRATRAKEH